MKTHACSNTPPRLSRCRAGGSLVANNKGGVCVAVEWCVAVLLCCVLSLRRLRVVCCLHAAALRSALCALLLHAAAACWLYLAGSDMRGICRAERNQPGPSPIEPASRATPPATRAPWPSPTTRLRHAPTWPRLGSCEDSPLCRRPRQTSWRKSSARLGASGGNAEEAGTRRSSRWWASSRRRRGRCTSRCQRSSVSRRRAIVHAAAPARGAWLKVCSLQ
jgi:hypothetical protein